MPLFPIAYSSDRNADLAGKGRLGQTSFLSDSLYVNDGRPRQIRTGGISHDVDQGIHEGGVLVSYEQREYVTDALRQRRTMSLTDFPILLFMEPVVAESSVKTVISGKNASAAVSPSAAAALRQINIS
jgi:hypothetical protein